MTRIRDKVIWRQLPQMLQDPKLDKAELAKLLKAQAADSDLAPKERQDIARILKEHGSSFDAETQGTLERFLGQETTKQSPLDPQATPLTEPVHAFGLLIDEKSDRAPRPVGTSSSSAAAKAGWWQACNQAALPGLLFDEPALDSVLVGDSVFSKTDIQNLCINIASSASDSRASLFDLQHVKDILQGYLAKA